MNFPPTTRTIAKALVAFLLLLPAGCSSARKPAWTDQGINQQQDNAPRVKWYAHCETCNWCRGAFKTTQDVQRVVSEHNIEKHDWVKVAYYNQTNCNSK